MFEPSAPSTLRTAGSFALVAPAMIAAGDPGSTRVVYAMVAGLVAVGVVLIGLGIWLVRQTRVDPPVLAPLERMGDADWRKKDPATQQRILDEVRPEGAEPLTSPKAQPKLDAEFDMPARPAATLSELSDLGPGVASQSDTPPPPAAPPPPGPPVPTPAIPTTGEAVADERANDVADVVVDGDPIVDDSPDTSDR